MEVLFQFLVDIWERLIPWLYLDPDERGVQWRGLPGIAWLRKRWDVAFFPENGLRVWEIGPGVHWKIPFVDGYTSEVVKDRYLELDNITGESADGLTVLVTMSVKFSIGNIKRACLEVEDFETSLCTDIQNCVLLWVERHNYADITSVKLREDCTAEVKTIGTVWGCRVKEIGVNSRAKHKLYRLLTE